MRESKHLTPELILQQPPLAVWLSKQVAKAGFVWLARHPPFAHIPGCCQWQHGQVYGAEAAIKVEPKLGL